MTLITFIRVHRQNTSDKSQIPDLTALKETYTLALNYSDHLCVVLPSTDTALVHAAKSIVGAEILEISNWGNFIPALNECVRFAAERKAGYICFQSAEVHTTSDEIDALISHLADGHTLVAGKAFADHDFEIGTQKLDGRTTPWNTLAVWKTEKLALTGFLMVADGVHDGVDGGVEEVSVIALQQRILPNSSQAKLVKFQSRDDNDGWTAKW
ncbi:hypothetical protein BJ742DRAFT_13031 [Cladochytrium replicatum]|nr:hypothetical protein BJ742DRAFT_13031 [Cladochytrium replicatum]